MEKSVTVELLSGESAEIIVRKLALGDYGELLKRIRKLPAQLSVFIDGADSEELKDMKFKDMIADFVPMLGESWDDVIGIISVATDKEPEWLAKNLELDGGIELLITALELNNISKIVSSVKKFMARKPAPQQPQEQTSTQAEEAKTEEPK